jgi:holo-[acyl-carrier protein] synthase
VEIERFSRYIELGGDRFLRRVYSTEELANCRGQVPRLAGRFAAKEAIAKALGTGIRGIGWREMEVLPDPRGRPVVQLAGRAAERADELGLPHWAISISHSSLLAIAFVVACGPEVPAGDCCPSASMQD